MSTGTTLATHMPAFLSWTIKKASYLSHLHLLSPSPLLVQAEQSFPQTLCHGTPFKAIRGSLVLLNYKWVSNHWFLSHPTSSHSPGPTALQPGIPWTCHALPALLRGLRSYGSFCQHAVPCSSHPSLRDSWSTSRLSSAGKPWLCPLGEGKHLCFSLSSYLGQSSFYISSCHWLLLRLPQFSVNSMVRR